MRTEENALSAKNQPVSIFHEVKIFALKTGIILAGIFIFIEFALPDPTLIMYKLRYQLQASTQGLEEPTKKLALLSFIQNPRALLRVSEIEEANGKIDSAIRETDLAIGLLEMHGADKQVIHNYEERLGKLKEKKSRLDEAGTKK